MGTVTGRFSCSEPTMVEIDKDSQEDTKEQQEVASDRVYGLGRLASPETEEMRLNRIHRGTKE